MASIVKDSIQYSGIADELPSFRGPACFREFNIETTLVLPESKPDIRQIVKIMSEVVSEDMRVVKSLKNVLDDGRICTGRKLIVEGKLIEKVNYIADTSNGEIFAACFFIPFSQSIALPEDFKIGTPIMVTGYIEDIYAELLEKREIYKNSDILLTAEY